MGENFGVLFNVVVIKYKCQDRQSLRGIIHGCFQVCKHLISCILQCAIRDHLGHICCKLKHFKVQATLWRKCQRPRREEATGGGAWIRDERVQYITRDVYRQVWVMDNYAQTLFGTLTRVEITLKVVTFRRSSKLKVYIICFQIYKYIIGSLIPWSENKAESGAVSVNWQMT